MKAQCLGWWSAVKEMSRADTWVDSKVLSTVEHLAPRWVDMTVRLLEMSAAARTDTQMVDTMDAMREKWKDCQPVEEKGHWREVLQAE